MSAAVEAGYILVFAPPPYVVVSGAAGAPPTAIPALTPTSPPENPGGGPALVVPTAPPVPTTTPVPTAPPVPTAVPMGPAAQIVAEPDDGSVPLVAFIDGARSSLDGEIYLLSDPSVLAAFAQAEARGVRVQLILEQHPFGGDVSSPSAAYAYLTARGVGVHWSSVAFRFTHTKALVADRTRAWIGTMNWTPTSFSRNRDFAAVTDDTATVDAAETTVLSDWAGETVAWPLSALVVSPVNARTTLLGLINGANDSLDLYAEAVTDPQVIAALTIAERRGVRVRLLYTNITGLGDLSALERAGGIVRRVTYLYVHAKTIVADGTSLFVGSENLSATSLDKNREVGVVLHDQAAIARVEQSFLTDLRRGLDPAPSVPPAPSTPTAGATAAGPTAIGTPGPSAAFLVQAWVTPETMLYDAYPVLTVRTQLGAACTADVTYSTGYPPRSFDGASETAGADGLVRWAWHEMTKGDSGEANVSCMLTGQTRTARTEFAVTH